MNKICLSATALLLGAINVYAQTNQTVTGNLTVDGNTTLGNASSDTTSINGNLNVNNSTAIFSRTLGDIANAGNAFRSTADFQPTTANGQRATGASGRAELNSGQNLTRGISSGGGLTGMEGLATHNGAGLVTAAVGTSGLTSLNSTGNVTSAIAMLARQPSINSTGVVVDAYGVYIEDQKKTGVSGKGYGVYANGTDNLNVVAGQLRVGGTTDPASGVALDVTGSVAVSGTLTVGGNELPPVATIVTSSGADLSYHRRDNDQIILGTHAEVDNTAALLVGNGTSQAPSNAVVVSKSGNMNVSGSMVIGGVTSLNGAVSMTNGLAVSGELSAGGNNNAITGTKGVAIGSNLTVAGAHQLVIGRYNKNASPNTTSWVATDPLFVVANGADAQNPNNALVVKKNGVVEIGDLTVANSGVIRVPQSGDIGMGDYQ